MGINNEWEMIQGMMMGDFNPNHDPSDGRFTSGSGGSSASSGTSADRDDDGASVQAKVRDIISSDKPDHQIIQDLMDLTWDSDALDYFDIIDAAGEYGEQLKWELGPANTNYFNDHVKPAIEAKKKEYMEKLPAPKKN
jgi:hypothetical protein